MFKSVNNAPKVVTAGWLVGWLVGVNVMDPRGCAELHACEVTRGR